MKVPTASFAAGRKPGTARRRPPSRSERSPVEDAYDTVMWRCRGESLHRHAEVKTRQDAYVATGQDLDCERFAQQMREMETAQVIRDESALRQLTGAALRAVYQQQRAKQAERAAAMQRRVDAALGR